MASSLTSTTLQVNGTQSITGISSTLNNSSYEVPTSSAVIKFLISNGMIPRVGGTIYYINSSSTNTYYFFNSDGSAISAPSVGTDCSNYYYIKTGTDVDKYYVYNQNAMFKRDRTGTKTVPFVVWTYIDTKNQSYTDRANYTLGVPPINKKEYEYYGYYGRVYETLDGTYTGTAIGTGKSNTQNMMALRNGTYIQGFADKWRSQSEYSETIWYICDCFNKGIYYLNGTLVPNNTGCDDWYIPSKDELSTMKNAIGASTFAGMLFSGALTNTINCWSSSACYDVGGSWNWCWNTGSDGGILNLARRNGTIEYALALTRSF